VAVCTGTKTGVKPKAAARLQAWLITHPAEQYSLEEIAGFIGVSRQRIYQLRSLIPGYERQGRSPGWPPRRCDLCREPIPSAGEWIGVRLMVGGLNYLKAKWCVGCWAKVEVALEKARKG
jgi:hypothetical protein